VCNRVRWWCCDDDRAKQQSGSWWFNSGDLSYQAVPSVRVSVSTEHANRSPTCCSPCATTPRSACSCSPPCTGPCRRLATRPLPPCSAAGCPVPRCRCRPPCPGPCRRAQPPPPPPPPRKLASETEILRQRYQEAEKYGLAQQPVPCPKPERSKSDTAVKNAGAEKPQMKLGKGAMIMSGD